MFRNTEDPSSGSLVQCWAKNYMNGSIVSVDMDKVGVMAAYSDPSNSYTLKYTHAQQVTICCHNTDLVHPNGHNRTSLVIFSQTLYKAP